MWFLPLSNPETPRALGLRIAVPGISERNIDSVTNAVLVILDTALGERSSSEDIDHVEVAPIPDNPDSEGYLTLPDLTEYITWHKRKTTVM